MKQVLLGLGLAASSMALAFSPTQGFEGLDLGVEALMQNDATSDLDSMLDADAFKSHPRHGRGHRHGDHHGRRGGHHGRGRGGHGQHGNRKAQCGKIAWKHTSPTQAQNDAAKATLTTAFQTVAAGMPAVKAAFAQVKTALEKHPISKAEVNTAVEGVKTVGEPLRQTVQDASIDVINLLSAEQRATFNQVMARCLKGHR